MTKRKRRNHSSSFKAKVAMAAIRGDKTLAEIAQQYDVHPNQIQDWKKRLMSEAEHVFENGNAHAGSGSEEEIEKLRADLQRGLEKYFRYYNTQRRHTALDRRTPDAVYFGENELPQAA